MQTVARAAMSGFCFPRIDQGDTSRLGTNDQEMKVLTEMNELQEFENDNWNRGRGMGF
jgi:hypothetical protein